MIVIVIAVVVVVVVVVVDSQSQRNRMEKEMGRYVERVCAIHQASVRKCSSPCRLGSQIRIFIYSLE